MTKTKYSITIEGETVQISTAADLVVALDVLQGQHDREVLKQLKPHITKIIVNSQGLHSTLRVLIPDDQIYLIEALGTHLVSVVEKIAPLRDILATLEEMKVEVKIMETLGSEGLRYLINSAEGLSEILEWVYEKCDKLVLDLLGTEFLKNLFQSGYELSLVLYSLDYTRQEALIDILSWENVMLLIRNRRDLAHLFRALPVKLSKRLLTYFTKDQLWNIIRDEHGWCYLCNYLEAEEIAYLSKLLGVK